MTTAFTDNPMLSGLTVRERAAVDVHIDAIDSAALFLSDVNPADLLAQALCGTAETAGSEVAGAARAYAEALTEWHRCLGALAVDLLDPHGGLSPAAGRYLLAEAGALDAASGRFYRGLVAAGAVASAPAAA